ncbi:MAG TPA: hypothetical protein VFT22_06895 [Kofleriaceae bacterium]|nr:hypothetical protein [Kofleriaceae bacterium]
MLLCQWNKEEGLKALHRAAKELVGTLGLYREGRARMVVQIVDAGVAPGPGDDGLFLMVRCGVVAAATRGPAQIGRTFDVRSRLPATSQFWSIEPLNATTTDEAITQAEAAMGLSEHLVWKR